jgi:ABC-2 type transport system ATP-binding protein
MLETDNLTKIYRTSARSGWLRRAEHQEVVAVADLNLTIQPGEIVGLLGLNGAGKTTTVKLLCTLLDPTRGTAIIDGFDLLRHPNAIRQRINMVAGGQRMLYLQLTARENLWYFCQLYDVDPAVVPERIDRLLALVGLADKADISVEKFSTGMKQRLQVARALINDPSYLFLDEPTVGLDVPIAHELRRSVRQLAVADGKAILLTTHNMVEAEELSDRIYIIHKGRIIETGAPDAIKRKFCQRNQMVLLVSQRDSELTPVLDQLQQCYTADVTTRMSNEGTELMIHVPLQVPTAAIISTLVNAQCNIVRFANVEPSLENVIFGQIVTL